MLTTANDVHIFSEKLNICQLLIPRGNTMASRLLDWWSVTFQTSTNKMKNVNTTTITSATLVRKDGTCTTHLTFLTLPGFGVSLTLAHTNTQLYDHTPSVNHNFSTFIYIHYLHIHSTVFSTLGDIQSSTHSSITVAGRHLMHRPHSPPV